MALDCIMNGVMVVFPYYIYHSDEQFVEKYMDTNTVTVNMLIDGQIYIWIIFLNPITFDANYFIVDYSG